MSHTDRDVLIMGSDGLWDVTSNQRAASIVHSSLEQFDPTETCRYSYCSQPASYVTGPSSSEEEMC